MEQVTETQQVATQDGGESASERMRRAWATRRANAASGSTVRKAPTSTKTAEPVRRGRSRKTEAPREEKTRVRAGHAAKASAYPFYLSHTEYTLAQVRELGVLAVTTDGQSYRLLKTTLGPVSARSVVIR